MKQAKKMAELTKNAQNRLNRENKIKAKEAEERHRQWLADEPKRAKKEYDVILGKINECAAHGENSLVVNIEESGVIKLLREEGFWVDVDEYYSDEFQYGKDGEIERTGGKVLETQLKISW
jgi:hypothetical protein